MPAPVRTARKQWIDDGLRALAAGGPEAVRIEPLAQRLGVSKGGFYWHFENRSALLEAMLDSWERTVIDQVIASVEGAGTDARDRLRRLFAQAAELSELLAIEMAIRDWARRDDAVAVRLRRVDTRRAEYMHGLFAEFCDDDEADVRCLLAFSLFVADPLIATDRRRRTRIVERALAGLLA